jgi:DNA repair protein RadC
MKQNQHVSLFEVAEIQLSYKNNVSPKLRPIITCPKDAYDILLNNWDLNKIEFVEQFKVMLLNRASKVIGLFELSTGGVSATIVDPKLIFAAAIKSNASYIIVCHNHPSGNLKPSNADIKLTQKIAEAGKLLDLPIKDHLIIAVDGYYSFADAGEV